METWNDAIDEANKKHEWVRALLKQYGEIRDKDISHYYTYGMRHWPDSWTRIGGAVFMESCKGKTGYHVVIAVPEPLTLETVAKYELTAL